MKIAICSSGNTLESPISQRFGRCSYFVIFDPESHIIEFIPNESKEFGEGAGLASVKLMEEKKAEKIISGEFGLKIKPLLDSLNIQMIVVRDSSRTVREIIRLLSHSV